MTSKWFLSLFLAAAICTAQNGGNDLFQQALRKERSDGDYKAAIEIYRRVLKQYASDRKLAAKSLLQIAHCQEREGSKEARLSYERLVREFGDQTQAVSEARARIAALEAAPSSAPRVRQLWAGGEASDEGALSTDGRWLTYPHWETGDLGVRDLVNGANKLLTNTGGWVKSGGDFAQNSLFSPDSKKIAYNWFTPKGGGYELRLMNSDGSGVRTLGWVNTPGYVVPLAWSPDGAQVLAKFYDPDGLTSLHLLNAASGEKREMIPPARTGINGASFSPDGKWIVMDGPGAENWYESDLYIMPTAGGKPERLESNPANDVKPFWSQDGASVLFASNRGGSYGLWRLPVRNGKAQGSAYLVRGDLGSKVDLLGFNNRGSLVYSVGLGGINIYGVDFDPLTAKRTSEPSLISQRFPGDSYDPEPSPDGRLVAFIARVGWHAGGAVVVRDVATGKERVHDARANHVIWTPDSKKLLLESTGRLPNARELVWMDPESGVTAPFRTIEPTRNGLYPVFSPDGRTLYITLRPWRGDDWRIMALDVETGRERELYKTDRFLTGLSLSSDGRTLATVRQVSVWSTAGEQDFELMLVPTADGQAVRAATLRADRPAVAGPFTADGKRVLISRAHTDGRRISSVSSSAAANRNWFICSRVLSDGSRSILPESGCYSARANCRTRSGSPRIFSSRNVG
jgi:Tol biopolymer transport system component